MTYSVLSIVVSRQVLLDGDFASDGVHHEVTLSQLVSDEVVVYQVIGCLLSQSTDISIRIYNNTRQIMMELDVNSLQQSHTTRVLHQ